VNQKFRQAGEKVVVNDLIEELKGGQLLINLVEILSGKPFPGKKLPAAKQRIQQIDVCNKALDYIRKDVQIKTQASAEDIVDGKENMVLGMIFQIIIKFLKFDDEEEGQSGDVKEGLMLWLKNKTAGYRDVSIENFTKSFHDGLAFCALIHKMRPKLIPYDTLKKGDKINNLTLALDTAAKYCNVEKYLEPTDIAKLDELSMIVYLSDWYYGVALLQKQDIAARRIGKLVVITELHDKMRADYKAGAEKLISWIQNKITELNDRTIDNALAGARGRLDTFYDYKSKEKSDVIVQHLDLSSLFNNLAIRLHNNNRPPFKPPQNLTLEALDVQFGELEKAEIERSKHLHEELARQIKLHNMADRVRQDAKKLEQLTQEQLNYFNAKESIDSVEEAEYHLENLQHHIVESEHYKDTRLKELKKLSAYLYQEKFENSNEIQELESQLDSKFNNLKQAGDAKKQTLEAELQNQKTINDNLCKDFSNAVKAFTDWLSEKKQHLQANKDAPLEQQLADLNGSIQDHSAADSKLKAIEEVDVKVNARKITNNPYTNISLQDCKAQWTQYQILLQKKKELLEQQIEESKKSGLTDEQIQEINDNFEYFDKDNSKYLNRRELRTCLQSLGEEATPAEVTKVFDEYDTDKDGKIGFEEFKRFMFKQLGDTNTIDEIRQAFKYLSYDEEFITIENLTAVVNDVSFKDRHVEYLKREMKPKGNGLDWPTWTQEVFDR